MINTTFRQIYPSKVGIFGRSTKEKGVILIKKGNSGIKSILLID